MKYRQIVAIPLFIVVVYAGVNQGWWDRLGWDVSGVLAVGIGLMVVAVVALSRPRRGR